MKRRREQERDEAIAREQAEARREHLLAELRARGASARAPEPPAPEAPTEPSPESTTDPGSPSANEEPTET